MLTLLGGLMLGLCGPLWEQLLPSRPVTAPACGHAAGTDSSRSAAASSSWLFPHIHVFPAGKLSWLEFQDVCREICTSVLGGGGQHCSKTRKTLV